PWWRSGVPNEFRTFRTFRMNFSWAMRKVRNSTRNLQAFLAALLPPHQRRNRQQRPCHFEQNEPPPMIDDRDPRQQARSNEIEEIEPAVLAMQQPPLQRGVANEHQDGAAQRYDLIPQLRQHKLLVKLRVSCRHHRAAGDAADKR